VPTDTSKFMLVLVIQKKEMNYRSRVIGYRDN